MSFGPGAATGLDPWDMTVQVSAIHGPDAVRDIVDLAVATIPPMAGWVMMDHLDAIAEEDPRLANVWLNAALAARKCQPWVSDAIPALIFPNRPWITTLPDNLEVWGDFDLEGCSGLRVLPHNLNVIYTCTLRRCPLVSLPDGLVVQGSLVLAGCHDLVSLPERFQVNCDLDMRDCPAWDQRIPDRARVGGQILTDAWPDGVSLAEYRRYAAQGGGA